MSEIDLSKLSPVDLVELAGRLEEEQVERRDRVRAELRERWTKEAEAAGFTVAEVLGQKKRPRAKPGPKYRHPTDAGKTWSGRGKKPLWLQELLDQGTRLEDLAVRGVSSVAEKPTGLQLNR